MPSAEAVSAAASTSPDASTVAVLVISVPARALTATLMSKVDVVPATTGALSVQVTVWPAAAQLQVRAVPAVLDTKVSPAGSGSVSVTGAAESEGPALLTANA